MAPLSAGRGVRHLVAHRALDGRGEGTAHEDLLARPFAAERDLDDLVLEGVAIGVDLELVEEVGVERRLLGIGRPRRREKGAGIHGEDDAARAARKRVDVGQVGLRIQLDEGRVLVVGGPRDGDGDRAAERERGASGQPLPAVDRSGDHGVPSPGLRDGPRVQPRYGGRPGSDWSGGGEGVRGRTRHESGANRTGVVAASGMGRGPSANTTSGPEYAGVRPIDARAGPGSPAIGLQRAQVRSTALLTSAVR